MNSFRPTSTIRALSSSLSTKLSMGNATVVIIGQGYVGTALATVASRHYDRVIGFDISPQRVQDLLSEPALAEQIKSGHYEPSSNPRVLHEADVAVICVPTPLTADGQPDMRYVEAAMHSVVKNLHSDQLVILESTVSPGTTQNLLKARLEATGRIVGHDVYLGYSPERINPGDSFYSFYNTPKVVAADDPDSLQMVMMFYSPLVQKLFPVSTTTTAELAKLRENAFRLVNIALAQQFAEYCDQLGVSPWEVEAAAASKPFGFLPFYPGPGIGGECVPVDPVYLLNAATAQGYHFSLIAQALDIAHAAPAFTVNKLARILAEKGQPLAGANIVLLGVAYKPNVGDTRMTPATAVWQLLESAGAKVRYHDPHVPHFMGQKSEPLAAQLLAEADAVIVITNHAAMDPKLVIAHSRLVFDARNWLGDYKSDCVVTL